MAAPRRNRTEEDVRRALRHAGRVAAKVDVAERERDGAIRFASETGASLREIAEATGLGHMTVKRIVDRAVAAE